MVVAATLSIIILAVMVGTITGALLTSRAKVNPYALVVLVVVTFAWAGSVFYSWVNTQYLVPDALYKIMGTVAGVALSYITKEISDDLNKN